MPFGQILVLSMRKLFEDNPHGLGHFSFPISHLHKDSTLYIPSTLDLSIDIPVTDPVLEDSFSALLKETFLTQS